MIHHLLLALLVAPPFAAPGAAPGALPAVPASLTADELPWTELAEAYRAKHGVQAIKPSQEPFEDFQTVLDQAFCGVRIGVFDVRYARTFLTEEERAEELRVVCLALLDVQAAWMERFGASAPQAKTGAKAAASNLSKFRKWLARARVTRKARAEPDADLIAYFGGGDKERALAASVADAFLTGSVLGFTPKRTRPAQVVFAPSRLDFISLAAYIGWMDEPWRGTYWVDSVPNWTEFYWNDLQVVALMYPPMPRTDDLDAGIPMDEREKTGLVQHVVQRGVHSLCWFAFGRTLDAAFESGFAQDLVIAVCGENNARSGGNGRGKKNDGWSMFIPGGSSQGGWLPKNNADSSWRETLGADHFVKVLLLAQREGGKEARNAKEKLPYFEITHDDETQKMVVRAPFFGDVADGKELPPPGYLSDYREFFRAYKTCFLYWLGEHAEGPSKKSRSKLSELWSGIAAKAPDPDAGRFGSDEDEVLDFDAEVFAVYGRALSAQGDDPASLEWEFLTWLAKQ